MNIDKSKEQQVIKLLQTGDFGIIENDSQIEFYTSSDFEDKLEGLNVNPVHTFLPEEKEYLFLLMIEALKGSYENV